MNRLICLLFSLSLLMTNNSCKKDSNKKYCWQLIDQVGNKMGVVCDKTEAELLACTSNGTCGISITTPLNPCSYYKVEGEELCWYVDNRYILKATENEINHLRKCFNLTTAAIKVDCNYCQNWYTREKRTYKPNSTFSYSPVTHKLYCGDTTRTLYQSREIILKNDADSLIVIQFSNNGVNW
jgi:hypothetical protein